MWSVITPHRKIIPVQPVIVLHNDSNQNRHRSERLRDRRIRVVAGRKEKVGPFSWEQPRYIVVKWNGQVPVVSLCQNQLRYLSE